MLKLRRLLWLLANHQLQFQNFSETSVFDGDNIAGRLSRVTGHEVGDSGLMQSRVVRL